MTNIKPTSKLMPLIPFYLNSCFKIVACLKVSNIKYDIFVNFYVETSDAWNNINVSRFLRSV